MEQRVRQRPALFERLADRQASSPSSAKGGRTQQRHSCRARTADTCSACSAVACRACSAKARGGSRVLNRVSQLRQSAQSFSSASIQLCSRRPCSSRSDGTGSCANTGPLLHLWQRLYALRCMPSLITASWCSPRCPHCGRARRLAA